MRAAVVANPSKIDDPASMHSRLEAVFADHGWEPPLWLETTIADPGPGQTRTAVREGVELVCALGGDGTVRCVAGALAQIGADGPKTPMAVLAIGTGNLLARNLNLPHRNPAKALELSLAGHNRTLDVAEVLIDRLGDGIYDDTQVSLVMTGIGVDAEILSSTSERMKDRIGWLAYVRAGTRHLRHPSWKARLTVNGEAHSCEMVSGVMVGNCGRLTGGIRLMPDAQLDDGLLDTVVLRIGSVAGWVPLVAQALVSSRRSTRTVGRFRSAEMTVECDDPALVEVDGDVLGRAKVIRIRAVRQAVVIRGR